MAHERLQSAVPDGEALRYVGDLRGDGAVGLTDRRLLVVREDVTSVALGRIEEVTLRSVDWFVALLSAALAGVGVVSLEGSVVVGGAFLTVAVVSLVVVYRKRGTARVSVRSRPKPLVLYPADPGAFMNGLETALDHFEERIEDDA